MSRCKTCWKFHDRFFCDDDYPNNMTNENTAAIDETREQLIAIQPQSVNLATSVENAEAGKFIEITAVSPDDETREQGLGVVERAIVRRGRVRRV